MEDALIRVVDLCKVYNPGENEVRALDHVDLEIHKGEFVAIIGQSGSGKSTLMNMIGCLDVPTSGTYEMDGKNLQNLNDDNLAEIRNKYLGFVFQSYYLMPKMEAVDNVALPLLYADVPLKERRERAEEALKMVGLEDRIHFLPNQMSGGQMQRVAIARALVNNPDILLADEPTGALDSETSIQVMELLKEVARDRLVVMVTHNPELAERYATRIVQLKDGVILSDTQPYQPDAAQLAPAVHKNMGRLFSCFMVGKSCV